MLQIHIFPHSKQDKEVCLLPNLFCLHDVHALSTTALKDYTYSAKCRYENKRDLPQNHMRTVFSQGHLLACNALKSGNHVQTVA